MVHHGKGSLRWVGQHKKMSNVGDYFPSATNYSSYSFIVHQTKPNPCMEFKKI